jgi:tRNA threonylcarbamoyladenosine biosynthesis protein TsaE
MNISFSLDHIKKAAEELLVAVADKKVIALHGEMGAGKTTLVHAVCDVLGVRDAVGSPTFSIINEYTTAAGKTIYHLDLYRLKNEQEAVDAGVEDCFYSGKLCLVEWPEIAPHLLPDDTMHCYLHIKGNNERMLQIKL